MNPEDISILMQECAGKDFDFAEAFLEETDEIQIPFQNGSGSGAAAASRQGTGLHLFRGSRSAYLYTNQNSLAEIRRLLALGREILSDSPITGSHQRIISQTPVINPCPVLTYPSEVAVSDKIRILRDMELSARSASSLLRSLSLNYFDTDQRITVIGSDGTFAQDRRVSTRIRILPVLSSQTESLAASQMSSQAGSSSEKKIGYFTDFTRSCGFEAYRDGAQNEFVQTLIRRMERMLYASPAPSGRMPVVFDAGSCAGTFFHEALGHALESAGLSNSPLAGMLGQQIASEAVTVIDDGTMPGMYGSSCFDDEGFPRQKNNLVEKGILKGYLTDRLGSLQYQLPRTGSGRRQNYTFAPASRMSNTYVAPILPVSEAEHPDEEMIRSIPLGLLVTQVGGGESGRSFSLSAQEAFLIKNGQIDRQVSGAILAGDLKETLMKIDRVGSRLVLEDGGAFCGASSGLVPTTTSGARIRVSELSVGGTGA